MLVYVNLNLGSLDRLVSHETAHQWFYGLIGTRSQTDPWIDEGGAQFLEGGLASNFTEKPKPPAGGYPYRLDSSDPELPRGAGIPGYNSIYLQGQAFYQTVLETMGSDAFWAAMHELYGRFVYGIVTPWDLLSLWQAHSPTDLRPLFAQAFRYPWIDQLPPPGG
jgi:aminopeptidase N